MDTLNLTTVDFNRIKRVSVTYMNLVMLISFKLNQNGENRIIFTFDELKKNTSFEKNKLNYEFIINGICQISWIEYEEETYRYYPLITTYEFNKNLEYISFFINHKIRTNIVEHSAGLFQQDLEFFLKISSSYAKSGYLLIETMKKLKQTTIRLKDFSKVLKIPNSYKISDIDKKVLLPIKKELCEYCGLLDIKKIKENNRRVEYLNFEFVDN